MVRRQPADEKLATLTLAGPEPRAGGRPRPSVPPWLARQVLALFAEARQRRRRRRLVTAAVVLAAAAVGGAAFAGYLATGQPRPRADRRAGPASRGARGFALPSALIAWFDGDGTLRIGNVATLNQRPLAQLVNAPCCTLIAVGHRVYWPGRFKGRDYIRYANLATGTIGNLAPGWAVVESAATRTIYVAEQSGHALLALPADGRGPARRLVTPPGWQVVPLPWAAADGITLSSGGRRPAIGLWRPRSGRVTVIGRGYVMATWTQPSGRSSLIAWLPARCARLPCPIKITSTATGHTQTVHPPPGYGFVWQGGNMAFSSDGRELATFVSPGLHGATTFVPALVNTATGTVRVVHRAKLASPEMAGWLVWLPGSRFLLAGSADNTSFPAYAIDARNASARPFGFFIGRRDKYPASPVYDITDSAVLTHQPAPSRRHDLTGRPALVRPPAHPPVRRSIVASIQATCLIPACPGPACLGGSPMVLLDGAPLTIDSLTAKAEARDWVRICGAQDADSHYHLGCPDAPDLQLRLAWLPQCESATRRASTARSVAGRESHLVRPCGLQSRSICVLAQPF